MKTFASLPFPVCLRRTKKVWFSKSTAKDNSDFGVNRLDFRSLMLCGTLPQSGFRSEVRRRSMTAAAAEASQTANQTFTFIFWDVRVRRHSDEGALPRTDENSETIAALMKTCCNPAMPTGGNTVLSIPPSLSHAVSYDRKRIGNNSEICAICLCVCTCVCLCVGIHKCILFIKECLVRVSFSTS